MALWLGGTRHGWPLIHIAIVTDQLFSATIKYGQLGTWLTTEAVDLFRVALSGMTLVRNVKFWENYSNTHEKYPFDIQIWRFSIFDIAPSIEKQSHCSKLKIPLFRILLAPRLEKQS